MHASLLVTTPPQSGRTLYGSDVLRIVRLGPDTHQVWIGDDGPYLFHSVARATYCRVVDTRPLPILLAPEMINEYAGVRPLLTDDGILLSCEFEVVQMTTAIVADSLIRLRTVRQALIESVAAFVLETATGLAVFSDRMQHLYGPNPPTL